VNPPGVILASWLLLNLLHRGYVAARRAAWERGVTRDADGLLPLGREYTLGGGPFALLMVHGFADSPRAWHRLARRLAADGRFTCRAMRLPGAMEPAGAAARQSLALWREAVDTEIEALRATGAAVWPTGHSLGGALALDAARRRPETVAGVVALAPLIRVSRRRSPLLPPAAWFRIARVALALSPVFESCFTVQAVARDDPGFTYLRDRFIPFSVYRALFALMRANRDAAAEFDLPLLMVTADDDVVVDTPAARRWFAACRGPKRHLRREDASHELLLEPGWEEMADAIAEFVTTPAEQLQAGASAV
jgi:alpha-beta hydrolase superfamily lysophospholipase